MFSTLGLFKKVRCPQKQNCPLNTCLFDHSDKDDELEPLSTSTSVGGTTTKKEHVESPPPKKRRIENSSTDSPNPGHGQNMGVTVNTVKEAGELKHKPSIAPPEQDIRKLSPMPHRQAASVMTSNTPKSAIRAISPPARKQHTVTPAATEKLIPRQVARVPVPFKSRLAYVRLLFELAKGHNNKLDKNDEKVKHLILLEHELVKLVLDEEQEVALSSSADLYKNVMSQRYLRYRKMSLEDWESMVSARFRATAEPNKDTRGKIITTGLNPAQEVDLLRGLKTAVAGLESFGYVTALPTEDEIQKTKAAVAATHSWEICDRCGTRFQVFPGRDAQGRLTTQGSCHYHWAKVNRTQTAKNARMVGHADTTHACCNQPPGSEGCTEAETHVFKVTDPKRLAGLLQFEKTPSNSDGRQRSPVAFDCEMGYTTHGMEMVRITAISWPDNKELLDVLVRPFGEILDLNTRFSGVTKEQFAVAQPYSDDGPDKDSQVPDKESQQKPLRKVESPASARQLLFRLLEPDTPLIGHAIENDLNVCRIIHPFIIDTVLLYPHPAGLPIRYGLKFLAAKYLDRQIQTAGEQGHDSKEDSVATGDLVRLKIAEKWKSMKLQGWKFEGGRLLLPPKP